MEKECRICKKKSTTISDSLGVCAHCIKNKFNETLPLLKNAHSRARVMYDLPPEPPRSEEGMKCNFCVNNCMIQEGERGYCGIRKNIGRKLCGGGENTAKVEWYYDPLPTNCVADWICPGGSGTGYPQYAKRQGPEYGYKNLAVFFYACSFNCLYCQNWNHKAHLFSRNERSSDELVRVIDETTSCICYFGGDPSPQLPYAIHTAKRALEKKKNDIFRICWETNGSMNEKLLSQMVELSLQSGGCIKFDLKAFSENLHYALCGVSNESTLKNFSVVAEHRHKRPAPPLLVASTLLVPEYVDEYEVEKISRFIANISPDIPYALLAFHPQFHMSDLPTTSLSHATKALEVAQKVGLTHVRLGNRHLLGKDYT
ncbi:MAG: radical SAM protein [Thermodesulfobacteriota bacterium]|nr:radical SAM protein [Thermodesulfobacteriota bacterium]